MMQQLIPGLGILTHYSHAYKLFDFGPNGYKFHTLYEMTEVTMFLKEYTNEHNNFNDVWAVASGLICFNDLEIATILKLAYNDLGEIYEIRSR